MNVAMFDRTERASFNVEGVTAIIIPLQASTRTSGRGLVRYSARSFIVSSEKADILYWGDEVIGGGGIYVLGKYWKVLDFLVKKESLSKKIATIGSLFLVKKFVCDFYEFYY